MCQEFRCGLAEQFWFRVPLEGASYANLSSYHLTTYLRLEELILPVTHLDGWQVVLAIGIRPQVLSPWAPPQSYTDIFTVGWPTSTRASYPRDQNLNCNTCFWLSLESHTSLLLYSVGHTVQPWFKVWGLQRSVEILKAFLGILYVDLGSHSRCGAVYCLHSEVWLPKPRD